MVVGYWIAGTEQAEAKHEVATTIRAKTADGVWMYRRRIINGFTETTVDILAVTSTGVWVIEVDGHESAGDGNLRVMKTILIIVVIVVLVIVVLGFLRGRGRGGGH